MGKKRVHIILTFMLCCSILGFSSNLYAAKIGVVKGTLIGSDTKAPLFMAAVQLVGTSNGVMTDEKGNFILRNVETGKRQIKFSYVGYTTKIVDVEVGSKAATELNVTLEMTYVKGQDVVVTGQRIGQQTAINDQVNSLTIKNVVAADRLQENPDANAAEALGRLPGISLNRAGGEGTGVVIRGLDPKYSRVLLNGVEIPSTDGSNRSTNVSGISQYALQGVEVFKAITPDMEANSVGGTINMKLGKAAEGLKYDIMAQGGYNNQNDYWKNYKLGGSLSDRFFDNKLGVMLSLNNERVNRSSQTLNAGYTTNKKVVTSLSCTGINLNDTKRINSKASGTLVLDYKASDITNITLNTFYSHAATDFANVGKGYGIGGSGSITYNIGSQPDIRNELFSTSMEVEHQFDAFELTYGGAISQSHAYNPGQRNWSFTCSDGAFSRSLADSEQGLPLSRILSYATDDNIQTVMSRFKLNSMSENGDDLFEKHYEGHADLKIPFKLYEGITANLKLGGKYKYNQRNRAVSTYSGCFANNITPNYGSHVGLSWAVPTDDGALSLTNLIDHSVSDFLQGGYNFGYYPSISRLNELMDWWKSYSNYYKSIGKMPEWCAEDKLGLQPDWYNMMMNHQDMTEKYYAAYIMTEVNFGDKLAFVPGVRYENVKDDMNGWWMEAVSNAQLLSQAPGHATTAVHKDDYFLPMVQLKYKASDWLQTMVSYTSTLNRPDYSSLLPNTNINRSAGSSSYSAGNPDLKPEEWHNYDLQVAAYGNEIGLISAGGFYKTVENYIWTPQQIRLPGEAFPFGTEKYFKDNAQVSISVPQNHNHTVYLKGLEFEVQTNLWYLPEPFNYITLSANLTLTKSRTIYQILRTKTVADKWNSQGKPTHYTVIKTDSTYSGSMLNQPERIVNFSFGYNYAGFNLWLSYQYSGEMITSEPNDPLYRQHKSSFKRFDLQVTQKLPVKNLELLFNYANINDPLESKYFYADSRPTDLESYGWTMDLGIRYRL